MGRTGKRTLSGPSGGDDWRGAPAAVQPPRRTDADFCRVSDKDHPADPGSRAHAHRLSAGLGPGGTGWNRRDGHLHLDTAIETIGGGHPPVNVLDFLKRLNRKVAIRI